MLNANQTIVSKIDVLPSTLSLVLLIQTVLQVLITVKAAIAKI